MFFVGVVVEFGRSVFYQGLCNAATFTTGDEEVFIVGILFGVTVEIGTIPVRKLEASNGHRVRGPPR